MAARRQTAGTREIKLAHPLSGDEAAAIGLDNKDLNVGDTIKVPPDVARQVITSGYAQIDPEDTAAVEKVVGEPKS